MRLFYELNYKKIDRNEDKIDSNQVKNVKFNKIKLKLKLYAAWGNYIITIRRNLLLKTYAADILSAAAISVKLGSVKE